MNFYLYVICVLCSEKFFHEALAGVPYSVIPAKFSMPRLEAWHPRMDENPPSPPFSKGGLGGFQGYFLTKPESRRRPRESGEPGRTKALDSGSPPAFAGVARNDDFPLLAKFL